MVDIGPILPYGALSDLGLTSACQTALSQPVACDIAIAELVGSSYVGSFNDATTTAAVCRAGCEDSIRQLHVSVSASCGHIVSAALFVDLIDMLWSNWNQSCFSDPTTGENCNGEKQVLHYAASVWNTTSPPSFFSFWSNLDP